jgi:potassium/chloride transporter 9
LVGHVIVSPEFGTAVPEARRQQAAWSKYIDFSRVKAFVNISISPSFEWGARNIALSAGLGGMRPNIAILGFYNMADLTESKPLIDISEEAVPKLDGSSENGDGPSHAHAHGNGPKLEDHLPTDYCKTESTTSLTGYVTLLEDLLFRLQINVAVARGFSDLEFPNPGKNIKEYIDLWPIQMSAEIATKGDIKAHLLTTNFDTCELFCSYLNETCSAAL